MVSVINLISIVISVLLSNHHHVEAIIPTDIPIFNISSNLSEQQALDRLLSASRYDPRSGPPSDEPVTVTVGILLLTLASPDESSLKYEIEFLLNMAWMDNRLRYVIHDEYETPISKYLQQQEAYTYSIYNYAALPLKLEQFEKPFLDALHHHEDVWLPDVYFVKHGDFRQHIDPKHLALRIYPNGTIYFTTRKYLILSCSGAPQVFPFDVANCTFSLESVSHEVDRLEFRWLEEMTYLRASDILRTLNAYVASNKTWYCPTQSVHDRGRYSCLQLELIFNRDRAFYFTTVFIPGIILVTSSFITFWLEWNAVAARIMLGVTTMLNFFITSNRFRATLPVVSGLHAMNIWEGFSMVFIYTALLEFIIVNYFGRKRPRISNKTDESRNQGIDEEDSPSNAENQQPENELKIANTIQIFHQRLFQNPIKTAKTIDVVSRVVFPLAYFIVLIVFFVYFSWNLIFT